MKQQCPKCGNWVEGKTVTTFARKVTRSAVKRSMMATGAAIGSIIPGLGTFTGTAVGFIADVVMDDNTINKVADLVEDITFDNTEYEFICPRCECVWSNFDIPYLNQDYLDWYIEHYENQHLDIEYEGGPMSQLDFSMKIEDKFEVNGGDIVVTGKITSGNINVGDVVVLRNSLDDGFTFAVVEGIEMFRKLVMKAEYNDNVGILLGGGDWDTIVPKSSCIYKGEGYKYLKTV
ncbi:MAG: hypothetical protein E7085_05755 [Parabacteroides distasonis]|nr:hypothetical protein [Parabacteroides distasonis]